MEWIAAHLQVVSSMHSNSIALKFCFYIAILMPLQLCVQLREALTLHVRGTSYARAFQRLSRAFRISIRIPVKTVHYEKQRPPKEG